MKEGPDISHIAALIGDPARTNMLTALMSGKALTARELANESGITPQTASSHLAKLETGGLITRMKQGRHAYFTLSGPDVADVMEALLGLAAGTGHLRTQTGPRDADLRFARVCYNHLAGELGIRLYNSMVQRDLLSTDQPLTLTHQGKDFIHTFGINLETLQSNRAPLCRDCLDWSMRRPHLGGALGRALFYHFTSQNWMHKKQNSRAVTLTHKGRYAFDKYFPL